MPGLQQLLAGLEGLREFDLTEMHKVFAKVYMKCFGLYGDTIHCNDGTHLDGGIGIADDRKMQRLSMRIAKHPHPFYDIPREEIGNHFLKISAIGI